MRNLVSVIPAQAGIQRTNFFLGKTIHWMPACLPAGRRTSR